MNPDELIVEARARIIWGDEPASVRYYLTSNGMSAADAESTVQGFVAERTREIRKTGIRGTCIGAAIVCLCAAYIFYEYKHPSHLSPSRQGRVMFYAGAISLYGIWKLINGLFCLLRPKSERGTISELT